MEFVFYLVGTVHFRIGYGWSFNIPYLTHAHGKDRKFSTMDGARYIRSVCRYLTYSMVNGPLISQLFRQIVPLIYFWFIKISFFNCQVTF